MLNGTCRLSNVGDLEPAVFKSVACVKCLLYIYLAQPPYNSFYGFDESNVCDNGFLYCNSNDKNCNCGNRRFLFNLPEFSLKPVYLLNRLHVSPPLPQDAIATVRECCQAAESCCQNTLIHDVHNQDSCPATWDGWQCFQRTTPTLVTHKCPKYIYGSGLVHSVDHGVKKLCEPDGTWSTRHVDDLKEYTDYSGCVSTDIWLEPILILTVVAYIISIVSIIFTISVISSNKYLKKQYVFTIHRHLLVSLLCTSVAYVINALLFMPFTQYGIDLYFTNHILCRMLYILQFAYFPLASFCWMLAEGIHLYWLLFRSLTHGSTHIKYLPYVCWGLPVLLTVLYAVPAEIFDSEQCLTEPSSNFWIRIWLIVPRFVCLGVNVVILSVTLRLLLQKLKMNTNCSKLRNYLKVMRAMLMLVPLFGIHLFLVIMETGEESDIHDVIKMVVNGFQKFFRSKHRFGLFSSGVVSHDRLHSDSKCVLLALQKRHESRKSTNTTTVLS
ncbi:unnamed protein product [Bursaphelenchus okinawaensis]|uniref:G_PROTEIN_RECEP_F2_4 domain-containing protein n=1 Tax=Bursaphelenchus okinawaensis TaxID=465554 RepID=A0A811KBX7_9BILA|nr:unnamed protein product [Bursaphelenchus okinawaensis]CAG9101254.1 unnamed protein product [Bursaphelenchus okinawaensis]